MTPRDRVYAAFGGEPTDRLPIYCAGMHGRIADHILGRDAYVGYGRQSYREAMALWQGPEAHYEFLERSYADMCAWNEQLDLDLIFPFGGRYAIKPTRLVDERTLLFGDEAPDAQWHVMRYDPDTELFQRVDGSPVHQPELEELDGIVERAEEQAAAYSPTPDDFPLDDGARGARGQGRRGDGRDGLPRDLRGGRLRWKERPALLPRELQALHVTGGAAHLGGLRRRRRLAHVRQRRRPLAGRG
mgnify:CR=1 FL=1